MSAVSHATRADLDDVASTITRAFTDDPVMRWAFASAPDPVAGLREFMGFLAEKYFARGHLYVSAVGPSAGTALWTPPDLRAFSEPDGARFFEIFSAHVGERAMPVLEQLGRSREYLPDEPHFYLGVLAVDPSRHGQGLGSSLLAAGLAAADAGGFSVHLESSNPRNISLYVRHGFEVIDRYRMGDDGPEMAPMRREPRSTG